MFDRFVGVSKDVSAVHGIDLYYLRGEGEDRDPLKPLLYVRTKAQISYSLLFQQLFKDYVK